LHGNQNFWRLWETWFAGLYPDGTVLVVTSTKDYWIISDGGRRHFKNMSAVISRVDPKSAIPVSTSELLNYPTSTDINFSNYSLLQSSTSTYLVDFDTLRPFASQAVVRALGYNPQEVIDVDDVDIVGYKIGSTITATTTAPEGVVYQITDLDNAYYLLKDDTFTPVISKKILETNLRFTPIEKHRKVDLAAHPIADQPLQFQDGTLLTTPGSNAIYVMAKGKKRLIADDDTFNGLGYKKENVVSIDLVTALSIPSGEELFVNSNLISAKNKFLGDSLAPVSDLAKPGVPMYLVAEYPSGRILSGKDIDKQSPLASLTKLVTAYTALHENFTPDTKLLTYDDAKDGAEGNTLKLKTGDKISRSDAFNAMLVASVNQAARMIAHSTGLPEADFVNAANSRLDKWGADNTNLVDVTGLSEHNYSTARDLLKIFTKVLQEPKIKKAASSPVVYETVIRGKAKLALGQKNSNQIFRVAKLPYTIVASKTGYTTEGGATILMVIQSNKTKKQYVIATLGNMNYAKRFDAPQNLANWIIKNEKTF
jgi:D-alanyl-D-alanine endopeptidase (penicillin-binding protein 7)